MEMIHDEFVSLMWPGTDPIQAEEYRNFDLIESAVARPFQTALTHEIYPTVPEKGAALFHSLISNHPFHNGNKRTAVIALDLFYIANEYFLILNNEAMYKLAEQTASYRERKISHDASMQDIFHQIRGFVIAFDAIAAEGEKNEGARPAYRTVCEIRDSIRSHSQNVLLASS